MQRPPVFTVRPQQMYIRKLGESLEIPCDARDGDQSHRAAIVWYKVGIFQLPVPPLHRFRLVYLSFEGRFACTT